MVWPPDGAEPLELDAVAFYQDFAERGYHYGPLFQGLRAAWRDGDTVYAEVDLDTSADGVDSGYGIHPALLDSILHAGALAPAPDGSDGLMRLPFSWSGVTLHASGATEVRVQVRWTAPGLMSLTATGPDGSPVLSIEALTMREVRPDQVAAPADTLYTLAWIEPTGTTEPPSDTPWAIIGDVPGQTPPPALAAAHRLDTESGTSDADRPVGSSPSNADGAAAHQARSQVGDTNGLAALAATRATAALGALQGYLADGDLAGTRLLVLLRGATDGTDPAAAAVWGLASSAQSENPDRIVLVDHDGSEASAARLADALACGESRIRLRAGRLEVPRLTPVSNTTNTTNDANAQGTDAPSEPTATPASTTSTTSTRDAGTADADDAFGPDGTVLVTGATGALGGLVARHLVTRYGVRSLMLMSRRGLAAEGAADLAQELSELGAEVTTVACDVADRAALALTLAAVPAGHPLRGVVHVAGVLGDATVPALTGPQLATVLRPKADGAWNLHELTRDAGLRAFVLFSSAAGVLGGPGQGNYAAANVFLDALAAFRHARGLPALSLAWGPWALGSDTDGGAAGNGATGRSAADNSGMAGQLDAAAHGRLRRSGVLATPAAEALAQLDAALAAGQPWVMPARLDLAGLRAAPAVPGLYRGLVPGVGRRAAGPAAGGSAPALRERLRGLDTDAQRQLLLALVRTHTAAVLGHSGTRQVDGTAAFKQLGFDSLAAIELRNSLNGATGLRLPATLTFDHATPAAVAAFLRDELSGAAPQVQAPTTRVRADDDSDPIVIVGMGCRFPGGVATPEDLWRLVDGEVDAVGEFPVNRGWDPDGLYDPEPGTAGHSYVREGGFLYDADQFDAGFFAISPREATAIDPQQRLLLEVAWETLEQAGLDPQALRGERIGVFTGAISQEYGSLSGDGDESAEGYLLTGLAGSVVSGRIAYTFGLEGPAVTVDTACSSSLVAMHLAAQALRNGECTMALAGGVTVMATPGMFLEFSRQRGLAPDGRCKSFAAAANGTTWAEGAGLLLLERRSDAAAAGHPVLAVLRGSAVNSDGASNGLTAPNGPSQQRVIRAALASAGLGPADVDAVEGHGTGTSLGDPIEAQALLATYGQDRPDGQPLWLGSLKSNIGHAQAAAGVGGVIKMIGALRHGLLPATLHVDEPTPHVDWSGGVRLLTEPVAWPAGDRPRRAAVSSFGISGTNAHLILEEPAKPTPAAPEPRQVGPLPLLLSAKDPAALRAQAQRLSGHLREHPGLDLAAAARTLAARAAFGYRAAVVGEQPEEWLAGLTALAAGQPGALTGVADGAGGVVMLFAGQGAQRAGMGRELYAAYPVFAAALDEVCRYLDPKLDQPLQDVMFGDGERLGETGWTQPALFAFEVALYRLAESFGVRPGCLLGHSVGELAAAHVAGVLSLPDACTLVAARARLMQALPAGGAMVAVEAPEADVLARLDGLTSQVAIAAVNGPSATVISGDEDAVTELATRWAAEGVRTRKLAVSHAFHSPRMAPMLQAFHRVATGLSYHPPVIPLISNLTGELADDSVTTPGYWTRHVREAVRFHDGLRAVPGDGPHTYLEIGPGATLTALAQRAVDTGSAVGSGAGAFVPALRPRQPEPAAFVRALAQLHVRGVAVDWTPLFAGAGHAELPGYAFQRARYWLDARPAGPASATGLGLEPATHPLLATATELPDGGHLLTGRLSLRTHPWLGDHVVAGTAILPAAGFVELALVAAARTGCDQIEELVLAAPVVLSQETGTLLQLVVSAPDESGRRSVTIRSRGEDTPLWTSHATGTIARLPQTAPVSA